MAATKGLEITFNTVCAEYDKWRPTYVGELYNDIFIAKEIRTCKKTVTVRYFY
jgi:hypothetical protein